MVNMGGLIHFFICFHLLGLTAAGQESYELLYIHDPTHSPHPRSGDIPLAVSASDADLPAVSTSILTAESWVRARVLAFFPAAKISTIVVETSGFCSESHERKLGPVLPSLKNIFHSLTRWGLEKDIKVSAAFPSECLNPNSYDVLKPLLEFLGSTNSTYSLIPPPNSLPPDPEAMENLVSSHLDSLRSLGFRGIHKINLIVPVTEEIKIRHPGRKLSFIGATLPDPVPGLPQSPNPSPIFNFPSPPNPSPLFNFPSPPNPSPVFNFPSPPNIPQTPPSPMAAASSPATSSFPGILPPARPPVVTVYPTRPPANVLPAKPPHGPALPPCNPPPPAAPAPERVGMEKGMWCVAKPNVPPETLQTAMDYACGPGGADCQAIKPSGICYFPDSVVAHASYAFNSYWQKKKGQGGSCSFGGTAMVVNSDPSFHHCRFVLS